MAARQTVAWKFVADRLCPYGDALVVLEATEHAVDGVVTVVKVG